MTVGELIGILRDYPKDMKVCFINPDHPELTRELEEYDIGYEPVTYEDYLLIHYPGGLKCDCGRKLAPGKCPVCDNEE